MLQLHCPLSSASQGFLLPPRTLGFPATPPLHFHFTVDRAPFPQTPFLVLPAAQNGNELRSNSISLAPHSLWARTAPVNLKPKQMVIHPWQSAQTLRSVLEPLSASEVRGWRQPAQMSPAMWRLLGDPQSALRPCRGCADVTPGGRRCDPG